MPLLQ